MELKVDERHSQSVNNKDDPNVVALVLNAFVRFKREDIGWCGKNLGLVIDLGIIVIHAEQRDATNYEKTKEHLSSPFKEYQVEENFNACLSFNLLFWLLKHIY